MLFEVAAALVVLGLAVWVIGSVFGYHGVAIIGGVILIIAGSGIALTDLDIRTGETRTYEYTTINNSTVQESASISYTHQTTTLAEILHIGMLAPLGLGGILMLLGATLTAHSLEAFRN